MEALSSIVQLFTNLGFPVVMCLMIFRQNEEMSSKFERLVENTTQVMSETTVAVNNLTSVINDLVEEVHNDVNGG